jgi:methionyl-tRNA formyltransferase
MKYTNVIVSEKLWNKTLIEKLKLVNDSFNWVCIDDKSKFTSLYLQQFNIDKIFIPHWSYLIPKDIYENYECIVFHMTDLPFGRGGSPLQNLILRGVENTKISALKVEKGLDTGDIYLKKDLNLRGSATEIFERANLIIEEMIINILQEKNEIIPQKGKVTEFKRRKPDESNIDKLKELNKIYDYIRMLDAEGYPHAFIENDFFKFEFTDVSIENGNEIRAKVKIKNK